MRHEKGDTPRIKGQQMRKPTTPPDAAPPNVSRHYQDSVSCNGYNCNGYMVERHNRTTGQMFFGCTNYPRCDYTMTEHDMYERLGLFDPDTPFFGE